MPVSGTSFPAPHALFFANCPTRMIIYYPVSALMTLFTNVLQTPQDARVRSDLRLMHQVTSFLGTIAVDEETGGVHRMLRICAEFERIARTVVDKAERDAHSRRKRKNKDAHHNADGDADGYDDLLSPPTSASLPPEKRASTAATNANARHSPGNIARAASPHRQQHPATTAASMPTPSLTPPPTLAAPLPALLDSFTPPMHPTHSPAFSAGHPAATTDPTATPSILPSFVPQPGEFPNMFTEFSDTNQFMAPGGLAGAGAGAGAGSAGSDAAAAAAAFQQQFAAATQAAQAAGVGASADVWQVPMGGIGGMDWSGWGGMPGQQGAHEEDRR